MARTASFHKNPLTIAFGKVLKKMRNIVGRDTAEIAREIGITDSYYRLVEAGTNNLAVSNSLNLVNAFNELSNPLSYQGTASLLSAISIMEVKAKEGMEDGFKYGDSLHRIADELCIHDPSNLGNLLNQFIGSDLFQQVDNEKPEIISELILELSLDEETYQFLTNPIDYGIDVGERAEREFERLHAKIKDTPSLYLDFALTTLDNLASLPISVIDDDMHKWEEEHQKKLIELYALIFDSKGITRLENLEEYQYNFLWEENFEGIKFLFLENKDSKDIRNEFLKNLEAIHEKSGKSVSDIKEKIAFKSVDPEYKPQLLELLNFEDGKEEYKNVWVWQFKTNRLVGFASNLDSEAIKQKSENKNVVMIRNLTFNEAIERRKKFKEYWEK